MRTQTGKRQPSHPGKLAERLRSGGAARGHGAHPVLSLQGAIGNQATQRQLRAVADGGSGQPLDAPTRAFMEARFGRGFGQVRVHTDHRAAESAQAVQARAYTLGRNIAFAEGEYRPHAAEGRRLLAHELTHVVHQTGGPPSVPRVQRAGKPGAQAAKSFPSTVTFRGCDQGPFKLDFVKQSAVNAFLTTRDDNCIKSESLKQDILDGYDGLTIVCSTDDVAGACAETMKGTRTINLYKASVGSGGRCPGELAATIFHESIHIAERWNLFEGDLAYDCGASCFPNSDELKRGNASHCDYERSWLPFAGAAAGVGLREKGSNAGYVRLYAGLDKRGPVLGIVRPSLGIGVSIFGTPTSGEPVQSSPGISTFASLIGALRFDPGKEGGPYFSLTGGPELAFRSERSHWGYEVGTRFGYRWSIYDVSFNAGIEYDPTRNAGEERFYTLGATFQIAPKVRRR